MKKSNPMLTVDLDDEKPIDRTIRRSHRKVSVEQRKIQFHKLLKYIMAGKEPEEKKLSSLIQTKRGDPAKLSKREVQVIEHMYGPDEYTKEETAEQMNMTVTAVSLMPSRMYERLKHIAIHEGVRRGDAEGVSRVIKNTQQLGKKHIWDAIKAAGLEDAIL
jgi:hypothetical protein